MRPQQVKLYRREKELRKKFGKVWLGILKARQIGFTTYKIIDKLDKCLFVKNTNAVIVAHNREKLEEIFTKVKFAYKKLVEGCEKIGGIDIDGKKWFPPKPQFDNKKQYYFPEMNSKFSVKLDSRSGTVTDLHISEAAFIDRFKEMLRATEPSALNADITIETTANGFNEFKDWWDTYYGKENEKYFTMFFPRYEFDGYEKELPEGKTLRIPKELMYLRTKYNLPDKKIYWYIEQTSFKTDPEGALQEYPTEPKDAFIASGRPFFNLYALQERVLIRGEKEEFSIDIEEMDKEGNIVVRKVYLDMVWYNQESSDETIRGIDISQGLDHGDYHVIRIRTREGKLIAHFQSREIGPGDLAKVVDYIYNKGISGVIAPEINNHGHAFLAKAKDYIWYHDIYKPKNEDTDSRKEKKDRVGWLTNGITRPLMLTEYKVFLDRNLIELDEPLYDEVVSFVTKKGKPQAETGKHDDVIMADAICMQMVKEIHVGVDFDMLQMDL